KISQIGITGPETLPVLRMVRFSLHEPPGNVERCLVFLGRAGDMIMCPGEVSPPQVIRHPAVQRFLAVPRGLEKPILQRCRPLEQLSSYGGGSGEGLDFPLDDENEVVATLDGVLETALRNGFLSLRFLALALSLVSLFLQPAPILFPFEL